MEQPGSISNKELWNINMNRMHRYMGKFIPFLQIKKDSVCLDMGDANPKMEYLKEKLKMNVKQIYGLDFNFDSLNGFYDSYDVVFALEVLEHLQNPLWFMNELKKCIKKGGSIYLTIPCNPRWLWMEGHYNEISKKYLNKWILKPIELRIVRYKRIYFVHNWSGLFIGVRPLLRVLRGEAHWKSLLRTVLYFKYDLYEIKKDK